MDDETLLTLIRGIVAETLHEYGFSPRSRLSQREIEQRRAAASASLEARRKKSAALQKRRATLAAKAERAVVMETPEESETSERPVQRTANGADVLPQSDISIGSSAAESGGPSPTSRCWLRYASAFKLRHGAFPPRNAKANGILAHLVARLGAEEAPEVAEFYVKHDDQFYVKATHPLTLLVRDAEKLRTQWATGRTSVPATPQKPWWETWPGICAMGEELQVVADENPTIYKNRVLKAAAAWGSLPAEAAAKLGMRRLADEG